MSKCQKEQFCSLYSDSSLQNLECLNSWIRIQQLNLSGIYADPDSQPCFCVCTIFKIKELLFKNFKYRYQQTGQCTHSKV
jgi:hypothetical protein